MSKKSWYNRKHQFTPYTKADGQAVSDEFDAVQTSFERIPEMRDDGKGFKESLLIPEPTDPMHPVPLKMLTETENSVNNARDDVTNKAQQVAQNTQSVAANALTATQKANTATQAAESAQSSQQAASNSENMAHKWAANPVNEVVQGDKYSAYHYATKAAQSETTASSAAITSKNNADIATSKAEEAVQAAKKAKSLANGEIEYEKILNVPSADTQTKGIVQLTSSVESESEELGLTAKAGKYLATLIAKIPETLTGYIKTSSRSSSIDSESAETVATSNAVKQAYDKAVEAKTAANNANNNANGRVSKSGDTITGQLNANSGVNTLARGADGFNRQWQNLTAPYLVDNGNANGNNAYYPFIKGINRNGNTWGTAFSFGYETPYEINQFGRGCIHLIEDNGTQKLWRFEHNGDFVSSGDVKTGSRSLNKAHQNDFNFVSVKQSDGFGGLHINRQDGKSARFEYNNGRFKLWNEGKYDMYFPDKGGTLALTSDVVSDVRLGALVTKRLFRDLNSEGAVGAGYIVTGFRDIGDRFDNATGVFRPIQKHINGQWITISNA